jgi:hypothetical protein
MPLYLGWWGSLLDRVDQSNLCVGQPFEYGREYGVYGAGVRYVYVIVPYGGTVDVVKDSLCYDAPSGSNIHASFGRERYLHSISCLDRGRWFRVNHVDVVSVFVGAFDASSAAAKCLEFTTEPYSLRL